MKSVEANCPGPCHSEGLYLDPAGKSPELMRLRHASAGCMVHIHPSQNRKITTAICVNHSMKCGVWRQEGIHAVELRGEGAASWYLVLQPTLAEGPGSVSSWAPENDPGLLTDACSCHGEGIHLNCCTQGIQRFRKVAPLIARAGGLAYCLSISVCHLAGSE